MTDIAFRADRELEQAGAQVCAREVFGCGCSSCIIEWYRTHALSLNGWVRLLAPMPRRQPWHREESEA
jgi:hypothetical protein